MKELWRLDAVAQAELVQSGVISALELLEETVARIEALEPRLHAIESLDIEGARLRARHPPQGVLGGVPINNKNISRR